MQNANSARQFTRAFEHLELPITTANQGLVANWQPKRVWPPFWVTVEGFYRRNAQFRELMQIVFEFGPQESAGEHRARLQGFVNTYILGYRLIYEADVLDAINVCLETEGSSERILGFKYGKDGRGAMPDRYYQLLFKHKYLVVGNHHDVLGHLILLCDPQILQITARLAAGFSAALENYHFGRVSSGLAPEAFDRTNTHLRRINQLYTLAWNLCQEKLYVEVDDKAGQPTLNLIGAFNSVYNTIFDARLGTEQVGGVAGALGFFNPAPDRSILILPSALRTFCSPFTANGSADIEQRLIAYESYWRQVGLPTDPQAYQALSHRMETIVRNSLFARGFFKANIARRWSSFAKGLMADPELAKVFRKEPLLRFAELKIELAESLFAQALKSTAAGH